MDPEDHEADIDNESTQKVSKESPSTSKTQTKKGAARNSTTTLGRPSNKQGEPNVKYAMRESSIPVHCVWTEHKKVLVATELQFCRERTRNMDSTEKLKSKKSECGFLMWGNVQNTAAPLQKEYPEYPTINKLRKVDKSAECQRPEERDLAQMMELGLSIKHAKIQKEWLPIYEVICSEVLNMKDQRDKIVNAACRREWENYMVDLLIGVVQGLPKESECLPTLLKENKIDLSQLLKEEAYCFLAEYFNFRINEYFAKAFTVEEQAKEKGRKISRKEVNEDL